MNKKEWQKMNEEILSNSFISELKAKPSKEHMLGKFNDKRIDELINKSVINLDESMAISNTKLIDKRMAHYILRFEIELIDDITGDEFMLFYMLKLLKSTHGRFCNVLLSMMKVSVFTSHSYVIQFYLDYLRKKNWDKK